MTGQLHRAGRDALAAGDFIEVRRVASALLRTRDGGAEAHFLAGLAEAEGGRIGAALPLMAKAADLAPSAEYQAQLARLLIQARRDGEARTAAARAETLGPGDALTFDTIGCVHTRLGAHGDAVPLFEQAVAREPDNLEFRYNLAAALGFVGRPADAEQHFEAIIARAPTNGRAHYALSGLRRHSSERNHIARLEAALAHAGSPADQLRIRYALAKEQEECGRPDEAFRHLQAANDQHRRDIGYDFDQDARIFDAIETLFRAGDPLTGEGDISAAPIFVVGMPRTGTTLVDRILSSHPDVRSAGELQAMPLAIKQVSGSATRTIIDPATIAATKGASAADVGRLYLARAQQHAGAAGLRFVDKLPANFLYIGFIKRALPAASIVCLRRNPMDSVWSNYKNLFASSSPYYFYSYDLLDTARYFARFDRLMAFWRERMPGSVLELGYEALVADQEGETRRLLDHIGLDWDEACLRFQDNAAAVATPSAAQVRRPLNADAIGRWRAHEAALGPARRVIEQAGIAIPD